MDPHSTMRATRRYAEQQLAVALVSHKHAASLLLIPGMERAVPWHHGIDWFALMTVRTRWGDICMPSGKPAVSVWPLQVAARCATCKLLLTHDVSHKQMLDGLGPCLCSADHVGKLFSLR